MQKANLYLDDKLVGSVKASETPTFIFEGLSPNTNYRILVKTVDESGNESLGDTIQEKPRNNSGNTNLNRAHRQVMEMVKILEKNLQKKLQIYHHTT